MLKFLGIGAAFYPVKNNTSAYFIDNNELFLIDCGETVFKTIYELNIFKNIKTINILITHMHADHVGSLATLIDYTYYKLKIPVYIITSNIIKYDLDTYLKCQGLTKEAYSYKDELEYSNKYNMFKSIKYINTIHSAHLSCYSIIFNTNKGIIYYSGDTKELDTLKSLLNDNLYKAYIDTNSHPNGPHIYINDLVSVVPNNYKNKIYCMHVNDEECIKLIKENGFNIAKEESN